MVDLVEATWKQKDSWGGLYALMVDVVGAINVVGVYDCSLVLR